MLEPSSSPQDGLVCPPSISGVLAAYGGLNWLTDPTGVGPWPVSPSPGPGMRALVRPVWGVDWGTAAAAALGAVSVRGRVRAPAGLAGGSTNCTVVSGP